MPDATITINPHNSLSGDFRVVIKQENNAFSATLSDTVKNISYGNTALLGSAFDFPGILKLNVSDASLLAAGGSWDFTLKAEVSANTLMIDYHNYVFGSDINTGATKDAVAQNIASFTGIAPITVKSGKSKQVYCRVACPKFDRQTFHEFARLSLPKCQWARNYVEYYTGKGKKYHVIIRSLAFKWIRILFRCWQTRTPYDEATYMEALKKRGSIFATLHLEKTK